MLRLIICTVIIVCAISSCMPTFPIHALKKGEISGGVSASAGFPPISLSGFAGYGITDDLTAYAGTSNLALYRLGMYYAVTDAKDEIPEIGCNLSIGTVSPRLVGLYYRSTAEAFIGIGGQAVWISQNGMSTYFNAKSYFILKNSYLLHPSCGMAIPLTKQKNSPLIHLEIQPGEVRTTTGENWDFSLVNYQVSLGIILSFKN